MNKIELNKSCTCYDTYGLLEERLLDDLLKRCDHLKQKEALLRKFDIASAVQVPVNTKFFNGDDGYVSCMILPAVVECLWCPPCIC